ncbi:hypothetical protein VTK73DRAFT_4867 [Phialemonium thermophilum]|uniref:Uncharacterized protein n=1 Tax=Phialemonium thermophilum TaxID=223376 RepID=A0ABR3V5E2_9PEZI
MAAARGGEGRRWCAELSHEGVGGSRVGEVDGRRGRHVRHGKGGGCCWCWCSGRWHWRQPSGRRHWQGQARPSVGGLAGRGIVVVGVTRWGFVLGPAWRKGRRGGESWRGGEPRGGGVRRLQHRGRVQRCGTKGVSMDLSPGQQESAVKLAWG